MKRPGNGGRKAKKRWGPKLVPLLMLGSDGEAYLCTPAKSVPPEVLSEPGVVVAFRLTQRERDVALDCLQIGVLEASKTLQGIVGKGRYDA